MVSSEKNTGMDADGDMEISIAQRDVYVSADRTNEAYVGAKPNIVGILWGSAKSLCQCPIMRKTMVRRSAGNRTPPCATRSSEDRTLQCGIVCRPKSRSVRNRTPSCAPCSLEDRTLQCRIVNWPVFRSSKDRTLQCGKPWDSNSGVSS